MFFRSRFLAGLLLVGVCGGPAFTANSSWYGEVTALVEELSIEAHCRSECVNEIAVKKHEISDVVSASGEPRQITVESGAGDTVFAMARALRRSFTGVFLLLADEETVLEAEVFGSGRVLSVNRAQRVVTLQHRAIQEYGWFAGARSFVVATSVAMDLVPENGEVFFGVAQAIDGTFIITAIFE